MKVNRKKLRELRYIIDSLGSRIDDKLDLLIGLESMHDEELNDDSDDDQKDRNEK